MNELYNRHCWLIICDDCFAFLFYLLSMSILITVCRVNQFLEADNKILDTVLVENVTMTRIFCAVFYKLHYIMYTFTERNRLVICM